MLKLKAKLLTALASAATGLKQGALSVKLGVISTLLMLSVILAKAEAVTNVVPVLGSFIYDDVTGSVTSVDVGILQVSLLVIFFAFFAIGLLIMGFRYLSRAR